VPWPSCASPSHGRSTSFFFVLILVLVLVVVVLALGLVLVGAISDEVTRLATLETGVVASSPVLAVVIEAHEPSCDQGKLLVLEHFKLFLFDFGGAGGTAAAGRRSGRRKGEVVLR